MKDNEKIQTIYQILEEAVTPISKFDVRSRFKELTNITYPPYEFERILSSMMKKDHNIVKSGYNKYYFLL